MCGPAQRLEPQSGDGSSIGGFAFHKDQGQFRFGSLALWGEDHFHHSMLCFPLRLNSGLRIDFQCAPAARVSHEFLYDFYVFAVRHEHRGKAVAERVPADMLLNSRTQCSRPEDAGDEDIWPIRALAVGMWASEQPIMRLSARASAATFENIDTSVEVMHGSSFNNL
jgi:hypothetical protein